MACQLTNFRSIVGVGGPMRIFSNNGVTLIRSLRRKSVRFVKQVLGEDKIEANCGTLDHNTCPDIRPGDVVRVRSKNEIRKLLDTEGKTRGCSFTHEMYQYCGRKFRVLKAVESFFDESRQKMCRCRDTVILEGALCSGRQRLYFMKCDRNCFFFWKTDWLKKAD